MATISDGVRRYETGTLLVHFPEGHVCCDICPVLETYARKQCRATGEYLLDTRTTGWLCPLIFKEEKNDG